MRNLVDFNSRDVSMLDYILTEIPDYGVAEELSPLANDDHCTILLQGVKVKPHNYSRFKKKGDNERQKRCAVCSRSKTRLDSSAPGS